MGREIHFVTVQNVGITKGQGQAPSDTPLHVGITKGQGQAPSDTPLHLVQKNPQYSPHVFYVAVVITRFLL